MLTVRTVHDWNFNYGECKKMFTENNSKIQDTQSFDWIINNTYFYSFFFKDEFLGFIYYYVLDDGKLYVNVCAGRHHSRLNLICMRMSMDWFNCDIYAKSKEKTAIYGLYKLGFKKIDNNLYKYERNK